MSLSILMLNQTWFKSELESLGHQVKSASLSNEKADLFLERGCVELGEIVDRLQFVPDRIIYWDDSTVCWVLGLDEAQIPTLFYSVDTHQHHQWHGHFSAVFDRTLVAQRDYLKVFEPYAPSAEWFPLWANLPPLPGEHVRDIDVAFVGTLDDRVHPERTQFFRKVQEQIPVTVRQGDYRPVYHRAKIVLNEVVRGDLNFRVFEAMNCGAALVTPRIGNGLSELFTEGEELLCYQAGSVEEAVEKIRFLLGNEPQRSELASRGRRKVQQHHTTSVRAQQIDKMLSSLSRQSNAFRPFGLTQAYLAAYVTCSGEKIPWGERFLLEARNTFLRVRAGFDLERLALALSELTARSGEPEKALTFLDQVKRSVTNERLIDLAIIQKLCQLNRRERAISVAAELSSSPEVLCDGIDEEIRVELGRLAGKVKGGVPPG